MQIISLIPLEEKEPHIGDYVLFTIGKTLRIGHYIGQKRFMEISYSHFSQIEVEKVEYWLPLNRDIEEEKSMNTTFPMITPEERMNKLEESCKENEARYHRLNMAAGDMEEALLTMIEKLKERMLIMEEHAGALHHKINHLYDGVETIHEKIQELETQINIVRALGARPFSPTKEEKEESAWIDIKDKEPPSGQYVLFVYNASTPHATTGGYYCGHGNFLPVCPINSASMMMAQKWMPLPTPPK